MRRPATFGRGFALLVASMLVASGAAAEQVTVRRVRQLSGEAGGVTHPDGVAWLPGPGRFLVMQAGTSDVKMGLLEALGDPAGTAVLAVRGVRSENVAWDAKRSQLVMLDDAATELTVAPVTPEGAVDGAGVRRFAAPALGPLRAAGIAIDAATGTLFVLDRLSGRIAVVPEGVWSGGALEGERIGWIELDAIDAADPRGLGWDSAARRWFVIDATGHELIAVSESGEESGRWDLTASALASPRGITVAPSGDPTDDAAQISVYVADAGTPQRAGHVVEFKFRSELPLPVSATAAATLVRVINTAAWSPPSPDPSGIAYDKVQNRLLVGDGEVDEMSIYKGANFYECSLSGALLRTSNVLRYSTEPVGVAYDSPTRVIISDDVARKVFIVNLGADGHVGGSDDTWTSFSAPGSDPEGASYDKAGNRLFVADGFGEEVWVVRAGGDGNFGTSDDQTTHFDTSKLGITDPETMEYNPSAGTLYIIGNNDKLIETTVTGTLVNTITLSGISMRKPAGICLAPKSSNPNESSLYICDRGTDNDSNPKENDGKIWEISTSILGSNPGGGGDGGGTVPSPGGDFRIAAGSDDAEQGGSSVGLASADLELVTDGAIQTVGLRFTGVSIAKNAVIANAWIQFHADEAQTEATSLRIEGQAADQPPTFAASSNNLSSRPRTAQFVTWNPAGWGASDGAGPNQKTPSLTAIVQELVNRSGWASGNAMAFLITGSGHRTAVSYDGAAAKAPVLHIEIAVDNAPPTVNAGPDQSITLPAAASLSGTVSDDGLPNGRLTTGWSKLSGPGVVLFMNPGATSTQATFTESGVYVLRLSASDGEYTEPDEMQVTVYLGVGGGGGTPVTFEKRIASATDDAEQVVTGGTSLSSSDLELVFDSNTQFVGLRFTGITIPRNATITNAWIQFTRDESQSEATALVIAGQAADNPPAFTSGTVDVSARPRTLGTMVWNPPAWVDSDVAGPNQRTPSLTSIVLEVVSRPGWASGNAMVFLVTGTGHRTARAYDGSASAAALLHVEYTP